VLSVREVFTSAWTCTADALSPDRRFSPPSPWGWQAIAGDEPTNLRWVSLAPHRRGRRKGHAARAPGSSSSWPGRSLVRVRAVSHCEVDPFLRMTRLDPAVIGLISARLTARSTTISGFGFGPGERLRRKERTRTTHLALAHRNTGGAQYLQEELCKRRIET
jgi:hypothetical protein